MPLQNRPGGKIRPRGQQRAQFTNMGAGKSYRYRSTPLPGAQSPLHVSDQQMGSADLERGQVQDMIAASEARTDTKFAKVEATLQLILKEMQHVATEVGTMHADNQRTRATVRTSAFAVAGLIIAIAAFIMNGVIGSVNLGTKMAEISRDQAVQVYNQAQPPAPLAPRAEQRVLPAPKH